MRSGFWFCALLRAFACIYYVLQPNHDLFVGVSKQNNSVVCGVKHAPSLLAAGVTMITTTGDIELKDSLVSPLSRADLASTLCPLATDAKLLHSISSAAMIGSPCSSNARSCARWYAQLVTNAARCPACD